MDIVGLEAGGRVRDREAAVNPVVVAVARVRVGYMETMPAIL
jgi:hypothetical protein